VRSARHLEQAPGIILEHHTFAVAALIYDELPQGGFIHDVARDDAVLKAFANNAVGWTPHSPALVVAPGLEVITHTGDSPRALD